MRDTTPDDVAGKILGWGLGSTSKFSKSAFALDRFNFKQPVSSVNYMMSSTSPEETDRIITWVLERFKSSDQFVKRSPSEWNVAIERNPVPTLNELAKSDSGVMTDFSTIVSRIKSLKGIVEHTVSPSYIMDSAILLTKRPIYNKIMRRWDLVGCKEYGLPDRPQRTFRDIWFENFALLKQQDPRISYDSDEVDATGIDVSHHNTMDTPPFIWAQALRTPSRKYAVSSSQVMSIRKQRNQRYSTVSSDNYKYMDMFSRCYLIWKRGPAIRFDGSDLIMQWGENLRNSTLLSSRIVTTMQQGDNSVMVITLRETQIYALEIFRCEWFGSRKDMTGLRR